MKAQINFDELGGNGESIDKIMFTLVEKVAECKTKEQI